MEECCVNHGGESVTYGNPRYFGLCRGKIRWTITYDIDNCADEMTVTDEVSVDAPGPVTASAAYWARWLARSTAHYDEATIF